MDRIVGRRADRARPVLPLGDLAEVDRIREIGEMLRQRDERDARSRLVAEFFVERFDRVAGLGKCCERHRSLIRDLNKNPPRPWSVAGGKQDGAGSAGFCRKARISLRILAVSGRQPQK